MENYEARLFDLIEAKDFNQLNSEEQLFVLKHLSAEEYDFQRKLHACAIELEYPLSTPLPLTVKQKESFFQRRIPLYQVAAAAVLAIGVFALWPNQENKFSVQLNASTLEIKSLKDRTTLSLAHDTVFQYVPVFSQAKKILHDTIVITQLISSRTSETRMLEANNLIYPELTKSLVESTGSSMRDDQLIGLVPKPLSLGN